MITRHLIEGGIYYMLPIYLLTIIIVALSLWTLFLRRKSSQKSSKPMEKGLINTIIFLGSLGFIWGMLGQIIGFMQIADVIHEYGDIAPSIIAGGIKVSMLTTAYGTILLLISGIIWFTLKSTSK